MRAAGVPNPPERAVESTVQRVALWGIFLAIAGLVAFVCIAILRPFANVIAWSVVVAIVSYPLHDRLVRRTGRVALSAFMTSLVTVAVFVIPLLLLAALALSQSAEVGRWLQETMQNPTEWLRWPIAVMTGIAGRFGIHEAAVSAWIQQHLATVAEAAGSGAVSLASGLFGGLLSSALVVFASFLLLRDGAQLVAAIPALLPFERGRSEALLLRIKDVVHASVYGVVVIALVQGALCGVMFALLQIPAAALWGAVTVFASVLPVFGAFAVWGPGVIYLAVTDHWGRAMVLALWGTIVVSGIDNVLRPKVVAGRVGLNELAMLFAVLGGVTAFGGLGIVLGPVAFATAAALIDELRSTK